MAQTANRGVYHERPASLAGSKGVDSHKTAKAPRDPQRTPIAEADPVNPLEGNRTHNQVTTRTHTLRPAGPVLGIEQERIRPC
jgi:hypothetical protein